MTEPEKKKKRHYKRVECPYCHKVVGNVKNHITQAHPGEAAARAESAPGLDKGVLTGEKKPGEIEPAFHPEDSIYYCMECHAELRKGESECWNCGQHLDWEGIE